MLFDKTAIDPAKRGPKEHDEPAFTYLQSSSRPKAIRVRELLESWFANYPRENQHELKQRMVTSKFDIDSPVFELLLHATFREIGAEVIVHPQISSSTDKKPDFHVRLASGYDFYLEAVLARGQSDEERNREAVVRQVYSVIDRKLKSPEHFWDITIRAQGALAPNANKIVFGLSNYMKQLDRRRVEENIVYSDSNTREGFQFTDAGWHIDFVPIPKKQESIGDPNHRPLGVFPMLEARPCQAIDDIRGAVNFKVKHHSTVQKPLMVAINACHWSADAEDFIDGLYGSGQFVLSASSDGSAQAVSARAKDGIWLEKDSPKNQNLIAILGVQQYNIWNTRSAKLTVYENPYIDFPKKARIESMPRYEAVGNRLIYVQGVPLGQLFGLPINWPNEDQ